MLYPSGRHVWLTSSSDAAASAPSEGYFASHSWYLGRTRSTCVCCSIISDTRMWYGSDVSRHGSFLPCSRYQASRARRKRRRDVGAGSEGADIRTYNFTRAPRLHSGPAEVLEG